jgi:hypothetical protein
MSRGEPRVIARGSHDHRADPGLHTVGMSPSEGTPAGGGPPSPDWQQVQTLGVTEIVMTILEARKLMPSATAAAVSREKDGGGFRVHVRLLDETPSRDGNPQDPGRIEGTVAIFTTRQLSRDLADAFGDNDVIILK